MNFFEISYLPYFLRLSSLDSPNADTEAFDLISSFAN